MDKKIFVRTLFIIISCLMTFIVILGCFYVYKLNHPKIVYAENKNVDDIVILSLNDEDKTIFTRNYYEDKRFPENQLNVIQSIVDAGAKLVILDSLYTEIQGKYSESDDKLIKALNNYSNVYLPFSFSSYDEENRQSGEKILEKTLLTINNKSKIVFSSIDFYNESKTIKEFYADKDEIGLYILRNNKSRFLKDYGLVYSYNNKFYPNLLLKIILDETIKEKGSGPVELSVSKDNYLIVADKRIPLNTKGEIKLRWYGPKKTFKYVSLSKIYKYVILNEEEKTDEIKERLKNMFNNKVVIIGFTDHVYKKTPVDKQLPVQELMATIYLNLKQEY